MSQRKKLYSATRISTCQSISRVERAASTYYYFMLCMGSATRSLTCFPCGGYLKLQLRFLLVVALLNTVLSPGDWCCWLDPPRVPNRQAGPQANVSEQLLWYVWCAFPGCVKLSNSWVYANNIVLLYKPRSMYLLWTQHGTGRFGVLLDNAWCAECATHSVGCQSMRLCCRMEGRT